MGAATADRLAATPRVTARPRRPWASTAAAVPFVVVLLLAAACSSGDDDDSSADGKSPAEASSTGADSETTTTAPAEPAGGEPDEVHPHIEALLERYDDVVTKILADPEVARDRDDPLVEEFLSLFETGSDFAQGSLEGWMTYADDGTTLEPIAPDDTVSETKIEGAPQTVDDDEVGFAQCTVLRYVLYADGQEQERVESRLLAGNGGAVRVDGHWVLTEITTPPGLEGCFTEGGVPE